MLPREEREREEEVQQILLTVERHDQTRSKSRRRLNKKKIKKKVKGRPKVPFA